MNILLISGHGAGDPGAVGNDKRESDETRKVTAELQYILSHYCNVVLYPTDRNAYQDYRSGTLASVAQFVKYDYVLEVHFNALSASTVDGKTKGVEIYVPVSETNTTVEQSIVNSVSKCGLTNRGVKKYNWAVISKSKQSGTKAALLEVCFIDDADDMRVYTQKFSQITTAIANAIVAGFSLKREDTMTYDTFKEYMNQYLDELAAKQPSAWSEDARKWAEENDVIEGTDKGKLKYKSNPTREEVVQMLFNMFNILK